PQAEPQAQPVYTPPAPAPEPVYTPPTPAPEPEPAVTPAGGAMVFGGDGALQAELTAERAAREQLQLRVNSLEGELHRVQAAAMAGSGERIARQAAEAERDRMEQRFASLQEEAEADRARFRERLLAAQAELEQAKSRSEEHTSELQSPYD